MSGTATQGELDVFEFCCSSCQTTLRGQVDQIGAPFTCPGCGAEDGVIPEAPGAASDFSQMTQATTVGHDGSDSPSNPDSSDSFASEADYQAAYKKFQNEYGFTVSPLTRLFARMVDGICMTVVITISFVLAAMYAAAVGGGGGEEPDTLSLMMFALIAGLPASGLALYQWAWTASDGKTIGKKLLGIRVATAESDQPPGFLRGVVMRSWVNSLLGMLPFYSLVDICWIFGAETRCVHDYLAGTIVLQGEAPQASS